MAVIRDDADYAEFVRLTEERRLIEAQKAELDRRLKKIERKISEIRARCPLVRK